MVAKKSAPKRGDIIHVDFNPTAGREQGGPRYALVISADSYNQKTEMCAVCPITTKVKGYPFEVEINTKKTHGAILTDHIRNLDLRARGAKINDKAPPGIIQEVQAKLEALLLL